jgi:putative GTP pyrophosphokinase
MNKIREWKAILLPYEQAIQELKIKLKSVRNEYRELNEYSPIEFITGRVKKISSILEKAKRRNIPEDKIEELMEDIAGIRIMCQFKDDIYKVVELIRNRHGKDLTIVYEKDYIDDYKDSGYRSYHMIIKYPVQTAFGEKEILAELQIRTLAMNFWATIEHSLNYKYRENIPEDIRVRLKRAAEAAALLDEEMCEIRKEIINAQLAFEEKSNTVQDITDNIHLLGLTGKMREAIEFQNEFDELWEHGTQEDLQDMLKTIKQQLPRYKLFEESKE